MFSILRRPQNDKFQKYYLHRRCIMTSYRRDARCIRSNYKGTFKHTYYHFHVLRDII